MQTNTVLITGANGFLGKVLTSVLSQAKHSCMTLGRSESNTIQADLALTIPSVPPFDRVIHSAGKAHVYHKTEEDKKEFFQVNYQGTVNLCKGLEQEGKLPEQFVFISSVSVYGLSTGSCIMESTALKGNSPYALSKIQAEAFLQDWGKQHGVKILILRLPMIAGQNPPGNLGKMIQGIQTGRYLSIAGGKAQKSSVLAKDVAELLIRATNAEGIYNLTDGHHPSFRAMEAAIAQRSGVRLPFSVPLPLAKLLGKIGDRFSKFPVNSSTIAKITLPLTFDDTKARQELAWNPRRVVDHLFEE